LRKLLQKMGVVKPVETGYVDIIGHNYVKGWAKDNRNSSKKLTISVFYDGEKIGETIANGHRDDLKKAGHEDGNYAFELHNLKEIKDIKKLSVKTAAGTKMIFNTQQIEIIKIQTETIHVPVHEMKTKENTLWENWDDGYVRKHQNHLGEYKVKCKKNPNNSYVVIIGDLNLPQCKKFRVLQKIEIFNRLGIKSDIAHWEDIPRSLSLIELATTVIFYRIPDCKLTAAYLNEATRLNINIGYDIDDPVFDVETYTNNENLNFLHPNEKAQLINNAKFYASILRQCDFITTSTPSLAELIENHTKSKVSIWRNLMDSQSLNALEYTLNTTDELDTDRDEFTFGYMSGSRAHEADFKVAFNAIHEVMDTNKHINILIVGHAELAKKIKQTFNDRVKLVNFSNYFDYISYYSQIDVNIIPLVQNKFNDCKSAIRYLEASLLKKPTIVSEIGDFCNVIQNNVNGILIESNTEKEWIKQLEFAYANKEQMKEIGSAAYTNVMENYTTLNGTSKNEYLRIINNEEE